MSFLTEIGSKQPQVALIIETSNEYARGLLRGISAYIRANKPWSIYLVEQSRGSLELDWLDDWRGEGIIARIENPKVAQIIRRMELPAIDLSSARLLPELPCVETDNRLIAEWGADHLLERGYRQFGFCSDLRFSWSIDRCRYFEAYLQKLGYPCRVFQTASTDSRQDERRAMNEWLLALPQPTGIMACYDIMGQKLLDACRQIQMSVPEQVGIVGVDNDELLCTLTDPPLTSIKPNTLLTGYRAAQLLDRLMSGHQLEPELHLIAPLEIVPRQSTDLIATEDQLVLETVRFIRSHAYDDIKVHDIMKRVSVSRRALESRFRTALGHSPHEEIVAVKLKVIKQLLLETELTLPAIAERLGYKHAEYMSVIFKREVGISPGAYRIRQRQ